MRRILGTIICCFVMATGYIAYVIAERQTTLEKFARYNDSWAVSQTLSEYMRLEHRLATSAFDMGEFDRDDLRLRLDIMLSRLELFEQGNLKSFIDADPQRVDLIAKLSDVLETLNRRFGTLDLEAIKALLQKMELLDGPMTRLASTALEADVSKIGAAQAELRHLHLIYTALAGGLILCGIVLVGLLLRHNSLLDKAHRRMQRLTDDLRAASWELKSQNNRLEYVAHHDSLTGLPNRILFRQDLEARLVSAKAGGPPAIILLLDLDGFKDVNDTLGHDIGDALLRMVASRLVDIKDHGDLVCRLGGDEFAILSTGLTENQAMDFARRLMNELGLVYLVGDQAIKIGTCVGVAIFNDEPDTDELFKRADLALYEAKALGPSHACVFESQMQTRLKDRKSFEADLQTALQNGEMEVYYQPLATTATREICGYEALLRWTHPSRGSVSPVDFIPVAEKMGVIDGLGDWVLRTACVEAASWRGHLKIAVNLSSVQFRSTTLVQKVLDALEISGLSAGRLELEITESVLLDKNELTLKTLRELKAIGIQIAMDDFGTGYSSLGSLRGFPFDKLKIDRSFIRDVTTRADALAIAELVTGIGASLGMTTTAEGVETEEQFECVKRLGCDQVQGYLIGRPQPASFLSHLRQEDDNKEVTFDQSW
ncbi:EAL domain-containing protein [Agrobacterium vitis]|uniref:EAL domain-containing protein n=2 Tax=Agrobacterium vitis TaxID=373 RepID=A0ABD6G8D2_AGRVI|nr:EAL domain-containing protein [Agrobacterium vitis]MUO95182.1 EAL domain-containing protein [Agrobacterium vitis]MUP05027.1 EAL domain-containing protein [Agrobacterium vitis]MUZ81773.1 EAL domain-containing protein [Agrobacterium vitis]MVA09505.1 EAL domain-containing protein [Agrobacterium vitis]